MTIDPLGNDHPFGMTPQEAALTRISAIDRARRDAANTAREHGPVPVPWSWHHPVGAWLAQTNAYVATRYMSIGPLHHAPSAFADALAARRALERADAAGSGRVSIVRRAANHAYASHVAAPGKVAIGDILQSVPAHGFGVAIATVRTGAGPTHRTTYHLARTGPAVDATTHPSVDDAVRTARARLTSGATTQPIAVLRTATGVRTIPLELPTSPTVQGSALVTVVDGTGGRIEWRSTSHSLVAVVGLDGVAYPRAATSER